MRDRALERVTVHDGCDRGGGLAVLLTLALVTGVCAGRVSGAPSANADNAALAPASTAQEPAPNSPDAPPGDEPPPGHDAPPPATTPPEATPEPLSVQPPEPPEGPEAAPEQGADQEVSPNRRADRAPDDVDQVIQESETIPDSLIRGGPLYRLKRGWDEFNTRLESRTGIRLSAAYTVLFQQATAGPGARTAAGGDFDLVGRWRPLRVEPGWSGRLGFAVEYRHKFGNTSPSDLGHQIGSLWRTTRAFNEEPFSLVELWWRQHLFDDFLVLTAGKLDPKHLYNTNRLSSANFYFLNQAFSDNPARSFPTNGFGAELRLQPSKDWYFSAGVQATPGDKAGFDFDFSNPMVVGEVGFTPEIPGLGAGNYRLTVWQTGNVEESSDDQGGFAISFDQAVGILTPFLRYSINDSDSTATRQIVAAGVGVGSPPRRPEDYWGVGAAWGRPSDSSLDDQWVTEAFYRFQITMTQQLTLGAQLIINPSDAPDDELIGVFEIRWRVSF